MPQHGGHRGGGPWCALALLALAPMVTAGDGGPPECAEQAVSADGMLELLPKKPLREWARVKWKKLDAGSYQVILGAQRNKPASIRQSLFSGRAVFQEEPLSLRISPVHAADAGLYEAEFEDADGGVRTHCFRVWVWEPLQPPHVDAFVLPEARGWCNLSLLCTAPWASFASYSWSCSGDAAGALEKGARLYRRVHRDADPTVCYCNVSNAVSWSTANTSISAACRAAAAGDIEQALTVYEEVGKARTGQDPSATRNEAASGENTIYAVICKAQGPKLPQDPEITTIYSSLQPTRKSPSLRRKRLDPALVSTAYVEATGCPRRPPSQIVPPAPTGHHLP
ncbi:natural killer cell receptor 2B4-like isoform 2-T2 [Guaruba guarouba]